MKIVTIIAIASACLLCSMNSFADIAQDEYTLGMKYLALYKAKGSAQYFDKALEHLNNSAEQGNTAAASEFSKQTLKFYLEICDDDGKGFNIIMSSQIDELLSQAEASLEREKQFGCLKPEHEDILKEIKIMKRSKKLLRRLVEKMVQETDASKKGEAAVGEKKGTLAPPNSVAKSDERLKTGDTKTITLPGGATMEMIYCAPGSFMMGSPTSEEGRDDNEKQHQVTLTKGFWLGKYEVTQAQWQSVMGENPSKFEGDKRPVENVSWEDCQRFIAKVNAEARRQFGGGARLPTEAEWEYACRAGTTTAFSWGNALNGDRANCDGNYPCGTTVKGRYRQGTADVGSYSPNAWGFYDMHGNVLEWCEDWRGDYGSATTDPTGPASGERRVLRGGFWDGYARHCRSALRGGSNPSYRCSRLGFRLCCSAQP